MLKMNERDFNALAEKLYPDKQLREDTMIGCRLIVATEKLMNAKLECLDVQKKSEEHLKKCIGNFPGSFLKWKDDIISSNLRDLINFTFGDGFTTREAMKNEYAEFL